MNRFTMTNVALLMSYKVSPREVEKIVDRLDISPAEDVEITDAEEVRVAAVQLSLKRYASLAEYVVDMNLYVADAVNRRAQLVCFPAYAGMLPAAFLPQFDSALKAVRSPEPGGPPNAEALSDCLSYFSDYIYDAYYYTMSALAARHRVYILAGSALYYENDALCHRALLFDQNGDLAGYQDKISLTDLEQNLGLEPATEVKVFSSPLGPVSILTDSDADYYEIARVARSLGARVLLHPAVFVGEYTPMRSTLGLNMRVQENRLWGVQSVLVGDTGLGFAAEGACCVFAPVELTQNRNGTFSRSNGRFEPDILCTTLNLERPHQVRNPYRQDHNIEFLEKYIDRLY